MREPAERTTRAGYADDGGAVKLEQLITTARDAITVKRVFAEPHETEGVTIITAATLTSAVGAGGGHDERGQEGEGGGFGLSARPAGAYVIKEGNVTRLFGTIGAIVIAYLLARAAVERARAKASASRH
jgi:uncharacterized spore protein YtfJ